MDELYHKYRNVLQVRILRRLGFQANDRRRTTNDVLPRDPLGPLRLRRLPGGLSPLATYAILCWHFHRRRNVMPTSPEILRQVPLFALLDDEETAVLAAQVEVRNFAPRQRIYKIGEPGERAYVLVSGSVRVTTVDEDNQEVIVDQPAAGEFFGFASMLEQ